MGCATSCNHSRIIDSNALQLNDHLSVELISSPLQLINYFKDKDKNLPKCIFIFGKQVSFFLKKCSIINLKSYF